MFQGLLHSAEIGRVFYKSAVPVYSVYQKLKDKPRFFCSGGKFNQDSSGLLSY